MEREKYRTQVRSWNFLKIKFYIIKRKFEFSVEYYIKKEFVQKGEDFMPWYSSGQIEEVRTANDIINVIGDYVKLKRTGSNYMGLCPFHSEKSPSFSVSQSKQMYKCFGCGVSGNVFTFLMDYESYTFTEAVEVLAERVGITLEKELLSSERRAEESIKTILYEINAKAANYYYAKLKSPRGSTGYEYFKSRGLTDETIRYFGLGYAGQGGDELYQYLRHEGYNDNILKETGLFKMDERGVYDKFWNRVMFPIQDVNNKVIGFGGRVMGDAKPKYLNSPETKIFDKSRNLFSMNHARTGRHDSIILCEGYMDVIALNQAGFTNAVASLGTAFTEYQAMLLKRYTDNVLLTYDSDAAGIKAARRAIPMLRAAGIGSRIIHMEPYKDPDEFIKGLGTEEFQKRIENAENSFFFEAEVVRKSYDLSDPEQNTKFYHEIAKLLLGFEEKVQRENYLEAVAAKYAIRRDDLKQLVLHYGNTMTESLHKLSYNKGGNSNTYSNNNSNNNSYNKNYNKGLKKNNEGIDYSYRLLLSWLIEMPELYRQVSEIIKPEDYLGEPYGHAAAMLYEQLDNGELVPAKIISHFTDSAQQNIVADMFQTNFKTEMNKEEKEKALNELIVRIKEYSIDKRIRELKDMGELKKLINDKKALQTQAKLHIYLKDG